MKASFAIAAFALAGSVAAGPQVRPGCGEITIETTTIDASSAPIAPRQDPWYSAPADFAAAAPGQILKIRNATNLVAQVANASEAYHILYRTTDGAYQPAWAVTTLLIPVNAGSLDKFLSYQIPYDSADLDASPSYVLYQGGSPDISTALGRGWVVSTTDYEGPNAYFTAGVFSGHATVDSVRAVLSAQSPAKLSSDVRYALWGYSGGALACEWAAELQVQYAPELNFAGAALGGLTPNLTSVLYTINGTVYAGIVPAGTYGVMSQYPDSKKFLLDNLNPTGPYNATKFLGTLNYTLYEAIAVFVGENMFAYFDNGPELIHEAIPQRVLNRDGMMGYHGIPQMPLHVYKAIGDDVSPIADTDKLVDRYCEVGATIHYERNTKGNHQAEEIYGKPGALAFLVDVLEAPYSGRGCLIENVTIS